MEDEIRRARLLTIIFIVLMVVITVGSFVHIINLTRTAVVDSVRGDLESSAIVIASQIDGDAFASLQPGDENTTTFLTIRNSLHKAEAADPTFRYVYTMRQNGSTTEFVVDADYGVSPDAAKIGNRYLNATPAMISGFATPSAELQASPDQWGNVISGYAPIRDSHGRSVGLVGVDEDSTTVAQELERLSTVNYALIIIIIVLFAAGVIIFDLRRTRVEAVTQLAIKKLNQLNSIIRHDIFNTLTGLGGYVEMIQDTKDPGEKEEMLKTIAALTDKIQQQVSFTRDYQDLGLSMPQWQDVQEVTKKVIAQLNLSSVIVDLDFAGLEVKADPLLERVFFHLLENSVSHGETVTRIHGYYRQSGNGVIIIFEDNGIGIPSDQKEAIFNRKAFRDTGLGLFLVREILTLTGIGIKETGILGHGARFEIRVPKNMARVTPQ